MELNKEIRDVLVELAMIIKKNNYTNNQILIRSTYDAFRIQNIVEKLSIHSVSKCCNVDCSEPIASPDGVYCEYHRTSLLMITI